ncbi:MAG TPA: hypothetical protein VG206_08310 [Terriglobia bacterium]|nr:hypothetical protein [Terriglobia bacterium]
MSKRIKAKDFEVADPDAAMANFKAGLRALVMVPKPKPEAKRKRVKVVTKRKA